MDDEIPSTAKRAPRTSTGAPGVPVTSNPTEPAATPEAGRYSLHFEQVRSALAVCFASAAKVGFPSRFAATGTVRAYGPIAPLASSGSRPVATT